MRRNEIHRLSISVRGRQLNANQVEKQRHFHLAGLEIHQLLEDLFKAPPSFNDSLVTVSSGKYQLVGLEKIEKVQKNQIKFFHFRAGYVYRNREDMHSFNVKDKAIKKFKLGTTEYRYKPLHFTVVPAYNAIVADVMCHAGPTAAFLKSHLGKLIQSERYLLSPADLTDNVFLRINSVAKRDFERQLKNKLNSLRQVGLTLAKPNFMKLGAYNPGDVQSQMHFWEDMFSSILAKMFGEKVSELTMEELPFKNVRLSFSVDESFSTLQDGKNHLKTFLLDHKGDAHLSDAHLIYKDEESGELERAILKGATLSSVNPLDSKYHLDDSKMWSEQREYFQRARLEMET